MPNLLTRLLRLEKRGSSPRLKGQGESAESCKTKKNVLKTPPSSRQNGQSNLTTRTATKQSRWPSSSTSNSSPLNTTNICVFDFEDCGSQALVRLDTNLASRSDGNVRDIKTKYAHDVANFDEKNTPKGSTTFCGNNKSFFTTAPARRL